MLSKCKLNRRTFPHFPIPVHLVGLVGQEDASANADYKNMSRMSWVGMSSSTSHRPKGYQGQAKCSKDTHQRTLKSQASLGKSLPDNENTVPSALLPIDQELFRGTVFHSDFPEEW